MNTGHKGDNMNTRTVTAANEQAFVDRMLTRPIVEGTRYAATCTRKGNITARRTAKGMTYAAKYRVTAPGYAPATFSARTTNDGRILARKLAR
jgi:hypothetical protein